MSDAREQLELAEAARKASRQDRDRPATYPGGMYCENCDEMFIGEEWHTRCKICVAGIGALRRRASLEPST